MSHLLDLPNESLLTILSRCWRSDAPSVSATNRSLRDIDKQELYNLRKANGLVETWFYLYDIFEKM